MRRYRVLNQYRWILWIGLSSVLYGSFVGAEGLVEVSSQPDIDQGQNIYQMHCLECHGVKGHGDGPRATTLAPRPGNLISAATSSKTDEELLAIITDGVPRTSMDGWEERLTLDDRRNVLAYVRSLVHFDS
ncbi:MAG: cytochrome c [Nitrospirota bacterium]|nr:cytochrome c [Nitrospirota bacterium]MDH5585832.1 cytochrome c [Nitrospirota bacterium]MDH5773297.1 cytochrome c [Nitrospirota bacterium]